LHPEKRVGGHTATYEIGIREDVSPSGSGSKSVVTDELDHDSIDIDRLWTGYIHTLKNELQNGLFAKDCQSCQIQQISDSGFVCVYSMKDDTKQTRTCWFDPIKRKVEVRKMVDEKVKSVHHTQMHADPFGLEFWGESARPRLSGPILRERYRKMLQHIWAKLEEEGQEMGFLQMVSQVPSLLNEGQKSVIAGPFDDDLDLDVLFDKIIDYERNPPLQPQTEIISANVTREHEHGFTTLQILHCQVDTEDGQVDTEDSDMSGVRSWHKVHVHGKRTLSIEHYNGARQLTGTNWIALLEQPKKCIEIWREGIAERFSGPYYQERVCILLQAALEHAYPEPPEKQGYFSWFRREKQD